MRLPIFVVARALWRGLKLTVKLKRSPNESELTELVADTILGMGGQGFHWLVGEITIMWAGIEIYLDMINLTAICRNFTEETQIPRALEAKIATFKEIFSHPDLSQFSSSSEEIQSELHRLKNVRHDVVHGIVLEQMDDGARKIMRLTYDEDIFGQKIQHYTTADVWLRLTEIAKLNEKLNTLFFTFYGPYNVRDKTTS